MGEIYEKAMEFKKKYPLSIGWRIKAHSKVVEKHLNPGEKPLYVFVAQKNDNPLDIITTYVVAVTDRRIILGQKRLLFGYFFTSITPDLFNDLEVKMGLIFGKLYVDTVKELVKFSNIQREALNEIETNITENMMKEKKEYIQSNRKEEN